MALQHPSGASGVGADALVGGFPKRGCFRMLIETDPFDVLVGVERGSVTL